MTFIVRLLAGGVGDQRHLTRVLDRGGQLDLAGSTGAAGAAGLDLRPLVEELLEQRKVLVVDVLDALSADRTRPVLAGLAILLGGGLAGHEGVSSLEGAGAASTRRREIGRGWTAGRSRTVRRRRSVGVG